MKIHIEKNSVQETLIVPLYGRKICAGKFPELYRDNSAKLICDNLDYDFSALEAQKDSLIYEFGALEAAMRQLDIMWELHDYLHSHPKATLVNLGCGLDQTGSVCDNGTCQIVNIDFPDIIAAREEIIPSGERERNISCNLNDHTWMQELDASNGIFLFAAGVFHYFRREEVKALVLELANRFPGGRLVFDTVGRKGLELMLTKTLKNMNIADVSAYFSVDKPHKQLNWLPKIKVSTRGYMLGYYDMKSPGVRWSHRFLAKIADKFMKMRIIRMEFE